MTLNQFNTWFREYMGDPMTKPLLYATYAKVFLRNRR